MNGFTFSNSRSSRILPCLLAACLFAGCVTYQVDWNSRIGNYTYDQAIAELGPPDKSAKLTDGTTVAEWLTRRGYNRGSVTIMHGYGYGYPYYYHPWHNYYPDPPSPDYYIRLTFGPGGKLQSWKWVMR